MTEHELLAEFTKLGALKQGHFQLTSGLHSRQYVQCAAVFEYPAHAEKIVAELVKKLPQDIDTVIAPAIGGISLGYEVARALHCHFIFAEREKGKMALRRGFTLHPQEKILVVEDVVTTGGSVQEILELGRKHDCKVQAVAALVDRSGGRVDFHVPFISLLKLDIETFVPEDCPLCRADEPLTQPGSKGKLD